MNQWIQEDAVEETRFKVTSYRDAKEVSDNDIRWERNPDCRSRNTETSGAEGKFMGMKG